MFVLEIDLALYIYTIIVLKMFTLIELAFPFCELQNKIDNYCAQLFLCYFIFRYSPYCELSVKLESHAQS